MPMVTVMPSVAKVMSAKSILEKKAMRKNTVNDKKPAPKAGDWRSGLRRLNPSVEVAVDAGFELPCDRGLCCKPSGKAELRGRDRNGIVVVPSVSCAIWSSNSGAFNEELGNY